MDIIKNLQEKDLRHIWHPCSQMKDYESFPPIIVKKGEGVFLEDLKGNRYLDAVSSWWVNLFGHSNKRINEALKDQLDKLEHVIFANFSHEPAIELAERLAKKAPGKLNKMFFSENGSSAVEVALKISFQYHQQKGQTKKKKFIALENAYHGETVGSLSLSGVSKYSNIFEALLFDVFRAEAPDCLRCRYGGDRDSCEAECFASMEVLVKEKHEEISGIIIEPLVQGAAGLKIYSPVYLKKLRKLCDQYAINFIADEIAVGFGRTGKMWACEHADVAPDLMTIGKGLTGGYLPMALTLVTDRIYDAFYDDYETSKAFIHSHSYSGNALACRAAVATLDIFDEENIIENNKEKSRMLKQKVEKGIDEIPWVGEYRQIGMIGAIELVQNKERMECFDWKERIADRIYKKALQKGVLLRPMQNVIYFMPPYIINEQEMDMMIHAAKESILECFKERSKEHCP
ncbi:adenosylmethionine--8-amino-7-oxononanoate transaminase [Tindallia californiensis]|uniref:Adenosylmethionine-8-amino-7-oxononanoate aminotransferase n=1 Tax=Tindallia californiensis TaxID=159292 RepID=A0A1H3IPD1_9FIRM|nr:adenosylmethionine--8-amino-7-oxononanoate transaminase [Tindallia californiensis]SDY29467.1 adenosylmethionine-8-amino-7-oxononanoate aminotransferase [Tindallia californiensis]